MTDPLLPRAARHLRRARELAARAVDAATAPGRARVVPVELRSPLGHALPARLHLPRGPGPHPAVLLVPGGLDGARSTEAPSTVASAPRLARAGLAALVFAPSGRDGAPGPEDRNGPLHQAECAAALAALLARPEVDGDRVAVLSISFGVVMAAGALAHHPDLAARVREWIDWEGPGSARWLPADRIRADARDPAFHVEREAVRRIGDVRCPYRRFQGRLDHVHGPAVEIGLELARAAAAGVSPRVRLNDAAPPFDDVRWHPVAGHGTTLVRWLREAVGT